MDFGTALAANAADIEAALDALLNEARLAPAPPRLVAAMRHGTLGGGKRLRPFLLRETAALFGVPRARSLVPALAVECIHCYSLIHDDLPAMDDDDLRRGRPTVHRAFDEATAILAGDALLTLAFGILAEHPDLVVTPRLVAELSAAAGAPGMVGGQMADLMAETSPLDEPGVLAMQAMKTGALIRAAVRMGAHLAEAEPAHLAALTAFATQAGSAFQLADDLLDATSDAGTLGKAAGKDARRGKATLVGRLGVDGARARLDALVGDALAALDQFGAEADRLRAAARYFATREH